MKLFTFGATAVQTLNNDSSKYEILCVDSDRAHGELQDTGMAHAHSPFTHQFGSLDESIKQHVMDH